MRIVCPHCSHQIEVSQPDTSREVPDHAPDSTVPDGPRAAHSRAHPPQRLGRLTLLDRVGAGSFGEVWKARDTELNRLVAVKIPHAGIVPVHGVGHEEGLSYLVCDFIEGLTLADLLKSRRLTFTEAADLTAR